MHFIEVVIKDGNRTVNWEFPDISTVGEILDQWEKGYHACDRSNVRINDKLLIPEAMDAQLCQLLYPLEKHGKHIKIRVKGIKPVKEEKVEEDAG